MNNHRIYLLNTETNTDCSLSSDKEFMQRAEKNGSVYSFDEFVSAFNLQEVNTITDYIRVLNPEAVRVCEQCGSENVSFSAWVNYNTGESNQVGHNHIGAWCFDGCEETGVMYQDEYLSEIHPVFECTIEWDDGSIQEVLICTFDNCPENYDDDEIFFYGLRYSQMAEAVESGEYYDGWKLLSFEAQYQN